MRMLWRTPMLEKTEMGVPTRHAYGHTLAQLGAENPRIVVLDADLCCSTQTQHFAKRFPDRFFNCGICEANMVSIASGLALCGKVPFISSFACFLICKGYDQMRMSVAYPGVNVKIVGSHGGISGGEDGPSQQAIEDLALTTSLPGFSVVVPADEHAARQLTRQIADHPGPVYMRTCRPPVPKVYHGNEELCLGEGVELSDGNDVALIAAGLMVAEAAKATEALLKQGIEATLVDMHTIKPLDTKLLLRVAERTGAIVTVEEHLLAGGLGAAVSQQVGGNHPVPVEQVGLRDVYAESGAPEVLLERYGLNRKAIVEAALRVVTRKAA